MNYRNIFGLFPLQNFLGIVLYKHFAKHFKTFCNESSKGDYGTLKIYQNGESVKIADDVHDYSVMADGRILYLYDYSLNYSKGELHIWENGETRKIDDDVVCVIPVYETKYRGYNYGR